MQSQNMDISTYIEQLNSEFMPTIGGMFYRTDTGEMFNQSEVNKYIQLKIEDFNKVYLAHVRRVSEDNGLNTEQILINKRSKKKVSKKVKEKYDGGEFNMIYRNSVEAIRQLNLTLSEKGVWYSLGELSTYPTNTVMIDDDVPSFKTLGEMIGLSERNLRKYVKDLENKGLLKLRQYGYKKAIVLNPKYYATGKDLDIDTLKMFNLIEVNMDKINSYLD